MGTPEEALLWVVALIVALFASEKLVQYVSELGRHVGFSPAELGLLVALGADAPEVSSSLISLAKGASDVGLGVIVGSNIYNLAGLLGLSAVVGGNVRTGRHWITLEGSANAGLSALLFVLVVEPLLHPVVGLALVVLLGVYVIFAIKGRTRSDVPLHGDAEEEIAPEPPRSLRLTVVYLILSIAVILGASDVLVSESLALGDALSIPPAIVGTFALAIATSLPNTWAALALARRGMPAAAIATTFTSNSINAAVGAGLPSIFFRLHALPVTRELDVPWLLLMTAIALALLATRNVLTRIEGLLLIALYALFVAIRLTVF